MTTILVSASAASAETGIIADSDGTVGGTASQAGGDGGAALSASRDTSNKCEDQSSSAYEDGRPYDTKVVDGVTYYLVAFGSFNDGCLYMRLAWFPKYTAQSLAPAAIDEVTRKLVTPPVQFLHLDPVHGWWFVNTPMDFRLGVVAPVSATASVANVLGSAWVTVTATPSLVTFSPGEPGGVPVSCSVAGAAAPYVAARPGECSYTYRNSSAIAANGRTFTTSTSLSWTISYESSDGPGSAPAVVTTSSSPLAVAEVQALVTCTGPLPEQGGC